MMPAAAGAENLLMNPLSLNLSAYQRILIIEVDYSTILYFVFQCTTANTLDNPVSSDLSGPHVTIPILDLVVMANNSTTVSKPQQPRNDTNDSWIIVEKETRPGPTWQFRFSATNVLKRSATMPLLKRPETSKTFTPLDFETVRSPLEVADNGQSGLQWAKTAVSHFGAMIMNRLPLLNSSKGRSMTFRPDIEVRSKRRSFGVKKWKEMRVVLDTGCESGNWVSLLTLQRLGVEQYLPLTDAELNGILAFGGDTITPCGAINLTWRGITGRGPIRNCSQNFKTRFLVVGSHCPAPFAILIGSETIKELGLLKATLLVGGKQNSGRVVELPPKPKAQVQIPSDGPTFNEVVAENDKAKAERKKMRAEKAASKARKASRRKRPVNRDDESEVVSIDKSEVPTHSHTRTDSGLSTASTIHAHDVENAAGGGKEPTKRPKAPSARTRSG